MKPTSRLSAIKSGTALLKAVLLTAGLVTSAQAVPVLSLSDGALDTSGSFSAYSFTLMSSEVLLSDLFVPILIDDPTQYELPGNGVVIPAGTSAVEFFVHALVPEEFVLAGPTISIGPVPDVELDDSVGTGSLPDYIPEISIFDGILTTDEALPSWIFRLVSAAPVSADLFVPITVDDPAFFDLPPSITIPNGSTEIEFALLSLLPLDSLVAAPELAIQQSPDFTIVDGFAVGALPGSTVKMPEPATLALICLGLASLGLQRMISSQRSRRRRPAPRCLRYQPLPESSD